MLGENQPLNAECGMRNGPAGIGSIGRIPGSTSALQFRIPHFAFRISLYGLV